MGFAQANESQWHDAVPFLLTVLYRQGHIQVVKYLMSEQHCNMESRDRNGMTPLHLACM